MIHLNSIELWDIVVIKTNLDKLIEQARSKGMTLSQREEQRRSFVYGTCAIENTRVTRETVTKVEQELKKARS